MPTRINLNKVLIARAFAFASHAHARVCDRSVTAFKLDGATNASGAVINHYVQTGKRFLHFKVLIDGNAVSFNAIDDYALEAGTLSCYPQRDCPRSQAANVKSTVRSYKGSAAALDLIVSWRRVGRNH